jgi:hypothetical protein
MMNIVSITYFKNPFKYKLMNFSGGYWLKLGVRYESAGVRRNRLCMHATERENISVTPASLSSVASGNHILLLVVG